MTGATAPQELLTDRLRLRRWRPADRQPFAAPRGCATEAARAAIDNEFSHLGLEQIVSFTSTINVRSRAVMERLGMQLDDADDFDHPALPVGDRLRAHVLYRLGPGEVSR